MNPDKCMKFKRLFSDYILVHIIAQRLNLVFLVEKRQFDHMFQRILGFCNDCNDVTDVMMTSVIVGFKQKTYS